MKGGLGFENSKREGGEFSALRVLERGNT